MKPFYEQLGQKFVERISADGMYLFINESKVGLPCAYYSKAERILQFHDMKMGNFEIDGYI